MHRSPWIECGRVQAKRHQDFAFHPGAEGLAGEDFDGLAQQQKAGIGVLCPSPGLGPDRQCQQRPQQFQRVCRSVEERHVPRQSGIMGEQMADRNLTRNPRVSTADNEPWQNVPYLHFQIELSPLVKQHRRSRRRHHLG